MYLRVEYRKHRTCGDGATWQVAVVGSQFIPELGFSACLNPVVYANYSAACGIGGWALICCDSVNQIGGHYWHSCPGGIGFLGCFFDAVMAGPFSFLCEFGETGSPCSPGGGSSLQFVQAKLYDKIPDAGAPPDPAHYVGSAGRNIDISVPNTLFGAERQIFIVPEYSYNPP